MSTQVNSYSGGAVLPGTTVTTDKLKQLKLRHTPAGAQSSTDEVYDPLVGKVVNVQNCIFRKNGETVGTYDPLSGETTQIDIPDDVREPSFATGYALGTADKDTVVLPTGKTIDGGVVQFNVLLDISSDGLGVEYTHPVLKVIVGGTVYGPPMSPIIDESISDERTFGFSFCGELPSGTLSFQYERNSTRTHTVSVRYSILYGVVGGSGGGGGGEGSGDNDKVAVEEGKTAGYLKDILISASDMVTLVPSGNRLVVNVNLDYSSDPKLETMNESQVDGATQNYGGYQLNSGATKLLWDDDAQQSYTWLNAKVYQCMRLADAQGTITKCNLALCGTLAFSSPAPCFNVGIFDLQGNLLGQSGLKFYGDAFTSNQEMCEVDMVEASDGSLNLKRNTRYIVQLWTCGIQVAGLDRSTNYNYVYDYDLRQNLETSMNSPKFLPIDASMSRASVIPMISFGAESLT